MALAPKVASFKQDLSDLWNDPSDTSSIFQTADLIETFWANAVVTGYEVSPCVVVPKSTYAALGILIPPFVGDIATTAGCFESACSNLVLTTLFPIIAPPFITPPPIPLPGGGASPGVLTSSLIAIFTASVAATEPSKPAPDVADAIALYLQSWTILVTIPPAVAAPVPII
jgi:hypothetical protein